MTPTEANLVRQIRKVGVQRAKDIFSFLFLWEGESMSESMQAVFDQAEEEIAPPSGVSKKRMTQLTLVGEAVLNSFPKHERKVNHNSIGRRVAKLMLALLEKGPLHRSEILEKMKVHPELQDLKHYQIGSACDACPGIDKYLGRWSLKAVKKAS